MFKSFVFSESYFPIRIFYLVITVVSSRSWNTAFIIHNSCVFTKRISSFSFHPRLVIVFIKFIRLRYIKKLLQDQELDSILCREVYLKSLSIYSISIHLCRKTQGLVHNLLIVLAFLIFLLSYMKERRS
jgi:hypothetical protein